MAVFSIVLLVILFIACFSASWIAPHTRAWQNADFAPTAPSVHNWLGTDSAGHDILSNILYGGQISLKIGLAVALLSTLIGTVIGAIAGWYGRLIDATLMRVTDLFLVVPQLAVLAVGLKFLTPKDKGATDIGMIVVLVAVFWMSIARVVRSQVLSLREKEFVEAARASGASPFRIIFFHILPNCLGPIFVAATLAVAYAILTEAAAAFLGFGFTYPKTSWGTMISDAKTSATNLAQWYNIVFPGLAIFLTVFAINFIGDGLRDAFDPQATQ
jgi:peptide/nickel transport system permease protein